MEPDMIGKDVQIKSALLFCKPFHTIIMMKAMIMLGRLVGKAKRVLCWQIGGNLPLLTSKVAAAASGDNVSDASGKIWRKGFDTPSPKQQHWSIWSYWVIDCSRWWWEYAQYKTLGNMWHSFPTRPAWKFILTQEFYGQLPHIPWTESFFSPESERGVSSFSIR